MKVTLFKADLDKAILILSRISTKEKELLTSCICFQKSGEDKIKVSSSNSRIFVQFEIPAIFEDAYEEDSSNGFTIEMKRFVKWFENIHSRDFSFILDKEKLSVKAKSSKGSLSFSSFSPDQFFDWDRYLEGLKDSATINTTKLRSVLTLLNKFSKENSKDPKFSLLESKSGVMYSTNTVLVSRCYVQELKNSKFKVHTKEVGNICTYLSIFEDKECNIQESDNTFGIFCENSTLVFSSVLHNFPDFPDKSTKEDDFFFVAPKVDILGAINYLESAASEDDVIKFTFLPSEDVEKHNVVKIGIPSYTGEDIFQEVPVVDNSEGKFDFANTYSKDNFLAVVALSHSNLRVGFNKIGASMSYLKYTFKSNSLDFTIYQQSKS